ncbi:MAG: heavy metal sensor kinase [Desulforhopalus sp.]|jgi:heavy metal sensor kinase
MNFIHSIKFRFTLWYLAILSILLLFLATGVYVTLSKNLYTNFDQSLSNRAEQLAGFNDIIGIVLGGTFEEELGEVVSFYYYDKDQLQQITQHKLGTDLSSLLIDKALAGESSFTTIRTEQKKSLRIFFTPYTPTNPHIRPLRRPLKIYESYVTQTWLQNTWQAEQVRPGPPLLIPKAALVISRPINDIEIALERLLSILCWAVPLTIVLAGGGGVFLARQVFRPIEKITETAKKIEESDLSRRIDVTSKDELGRLATTLNQMIARLESAFIRQKDFTSDASHELRAPLTVIQAESTLALQRPREAQEYRKSLEMIAQESEHLAAIINQLLILARADAGKEQQVFEIINIADFVRDLCRDVEIICQEKKLTLKQERFDDSFVMGDIRSLRNLFHNLLDNAMRYTPEGGSITVMVYRKDTLAVVSIKDTGIGIATDEQSLIFERFYRVDKARSRSVGGSGLGLAICNNIIKGHGGSISVESELNQGSTFHVTFPVISPIAPYSKG